MTFYVKRIKLDTNRIGYVGPLPNLKRAEREATAWNDSGGFYAAVLESTPELKAEIRAWRKTR